VLIPGAGELQITERNTPGLLVKMRVGGKGTVRLKA